MLTLSVGFKHLAYHSSVDDELLRSYNEADGNFTGSTIYRLEIMRIELSSVYGVQVCSPLTLSYY